MVADSCYLSGLAKLDDDTPAHRPKRILYAVPASMTPAFVIDIGTELDGKIAALLAHESQAGGRNEQARERITAEASTHGSRAGVRYGEGFLSKDPILLSDLFW
jgi:LmbE family N-acetylglucosaminyl deacetylase